MADTPRPFLYRQFVRVSHRLDRYIAKYLGNTFPFYYVCEFPKSGGTWLGKMMACALDVSFPQQPALPIGIPAVVHNHWKPTLGLNHCVYLVRDGRDIMVSMYFHYMRDIQHASGDLDYRRKRSSLESYLDQHYDPSDIKANLPGFMRWQFEHPTSTRLNWPQHVRGWMAIPGIHSVRYEDLRLDTIREITRITKACGHDISAEVIALAVKRYDFLVVTGRRPGEEDRSSFVRKGIIGDWRNHFTREAASVFDEYAGDVLVTLGYEPDRTWVASVS